MRDVTIALRSVSRQPGATGVVVLTLALAIAAATVIASAVDMILQFIPAQSSDSLVFVASTDPRPERSVSGVADGVARTGVSIPDLVDWTERTRTFEAFVAFRFQNATLSGGDIPVRIAANRVTTNLFDVWGIAPQRGRTFTSGEGRSGGQRVVVISHAFWQRQLASTDVLGTNLTIDGEPHTVIGVLPASVNVGIFKTADVFVPLVLDRERSRRDERNLFASARLRPGVSLQEAHADLAAAARQLQAEYPESNAQTGAVVRPFIELLGANIVTVMALLGMIALLIVCIACANVSSIILAQSTTRRRELAVRAALGASRWQQIRQIMLENLIVSALAGVLGMVLAWGGIVLMRHAGGGVEGFGDLGLNLRVLSAAAIVALLAPFGFAFLPAWRMSKPDMEELRQGNRGAETPRGRRLREALLVAQVALVLVLMTQVGLIARTTWRIHYQDKGLDATGVLALRTNLPESEYADVAMVRSYYSRALERIGALPGVTSAATVTSLPIADPETAARFVIEGAPPVAPESRPDAGRSDISAEYLQTLRIPVVRGRGFGAADFDSEPRSVLASREAARRFWPNGDAIGKRISFDDTAGMWLEIVGIVGDVRNANAGSPPRPHFYVPNAWRPNRSMSFVVRSSAADPAALGPSIRRTLAELDRNVPVENMSSMEQKFIDDLGGTYLLTGMLAAIAIVALLLAAAGVYGLVSFSVSQRTREIGLRMALGAAPGTILKTVIARGAVILVIGLLLGSVGAELLASQTLLIMEDVSMRDPIAYLIVWIPLVVISIVATLIPASRATRVDPQDALRAE